MAYIKTRKTKSGKTVYRVQLQVNHQRLSATFDRKTDAKAWIDETRTAARYDKHFTALISDKTTLADVVTRYRRTVLSQPSKQQLANDRGYQLDWWVSQIGHLRLIDISRSVLAERTLVANHWIKTCWLQRKPC